MKIGITNDHRGYRTKMFLMEYLSDYTVIDYGASSEDSVDFPIYAKRLGMAIQDGEVDLGIAICGTGIGMSIALNKMHGVYCAKLSNTSEAMLCKSHNNANVMAISEDLSGDLLKDVVTAFIETPFSNINKYIRRNDIIKEIENA